MTGIDDAKILFSDSIIQDRDADAAYWNNRYIAGTVSLETVLMKVDGLDETQATAEATKIRSGRATIDTFGLGDGV